MFTHQDAEMHPLSVTEGKPLPINLIKIDHTLRNIYCLDQSLYIQLKSKMYTHLAESAKMLIILPSETDHTKCMLLFI